MLTMLVFAIDAPYIAIAIKGAIYIFSVEYSSNAIVEIRFLVSVTIPPLISPDCNQLISPE